MSADERERVNQMVVGAEKLSERSERVARAVLVLNEAWRRLDMQGNAVDLFALRDRAATDEYFEQHLARQTDVLRQRVEGFARLALDAMRQEADDEPKTDSAGG